MSDHEWEPPHEYLKLILRWVGQNSTPEEYKVMVATMHRVWHLIEKFFDSRQMNCELRGGQITLTDESVQKVYLITLFDANDLTHQLIFYTVVNEQTGKLEGLSALPGSTPEGPVINLH